MRRTIAIGLAALALLLAGTTPTLADPLPPLDLPACGGRLATKWAPDGVDDGYAIFYGTGGKDAVVGTAGDDYVRGYGGGDALCGRGGDNLIFSIGVVSGRDRVRAGRGDDAIVADDGRKDVIDCGPGIDIVYFDLGLDTLADCEVKHPV